MSQSFVLLLSNPGCASTGTDGVHTYHRVYQLTRSSMYRLNRPHRNPHLHHPHGPRRMSMSLTHRSTFMFADAQPASYHTSPPPIRPPPSDHPSGRRRLPFVSRRSRGSFRHLEPRGSRAFGAPWLIHQRRRGGGGGGIAPPVMWREIIRQ